MKNFITRLMYNSVENIQKKTSKGRSWNEVSATVNRRSTDSQIQRRSSVGTLLTRLAALFTLLFTLGVGQMWGDVTIYVTGKIFVGEEAWDNSTSTIKVDVRYQGSEGNFNDGDVYWNQTMTKTDYTYNGYPIYSYTWNPTHSGGQYRFKHYKSGVHKEDYTAAWSTENGKIYDGYYSSAHQWLTYGRDITIYAVPESMDGSKWTEGNTLKAVFKYGDQESEKTDKITWTKTDYTYNENYIYKCTFLVPYNVIKKINFYYNDGTDKDLYEIAWNNATQYGTNDIDGKIFLGWNKNSSGTHTWVTYGRDITIYTVPETLFSSYDPQFSTSTHSLKCNFKYGNNEWLSPIPVMTKTDWKYNNASIYKVTMLAAFNVVKQMAFQYFEGETYKGEYYYRNNGVDFTDVTAADVDGKIYTGYAESAHHWETYATDITLDQQSGSGGTGSITATVGSAMPAITLPTRVGYAFGGYYSEADGGGTQYYNFDGSSVNNWVKDGPTTLYAKWIAVTLSSPTILASEAAYTGEDITLSLSTTSTYLPEAMVIFYVTDNSVSKTYEVVATPGAIGDAPSYSTTHTATFKTDHPATYSVTAKVFSAKLIDNFDGSLAHWKALEDGSFNASATNPAMQAGNGSSTVMQITRGTTDAWKTVQTCTTADGNPTTNWNHDYGYIYMSMYSTTARTPKIKYSDDSPGYEKELDANSLSANTWQRKQFATTHDIDYILPFMLADGTMYIDDIILSNESSMTAQATSSSASTTITQPTIGSCTAEAATTNWGGSDINISLSAQTTYLEDAVVVFFVTDGSNSITYEVTATPGTPGANNAITHTATFVAEHAATYSVTAKLYNGKFIDNFEGSATLWATTGYGGYEKVANVDREANNGSSTVMKITRKDEEYRTAYTTTVKDDGTKPTSWNYSYNYIYMRYYAPQAETPKVQYVDNSIGGEYKNTTLSSVSADTWHHLQFGVTGGIVDLIYPFVCSGNDKYIYIDDIILSNRSTWAPIKNTSSVDLTADASDVTIREDYTVTFENLSADAGHKGSLDTTVTYGSTTNMGPIEKPSKTHYDFGGYWTSSNSGSTLTTQLIDENGNWIKNVTDYTGASGDDATWVYAGDITLYAKWTEHEYTITTAVSPAGAGSISCGASTTAKYVTASGDITATANAGWVFKAWQFSKTDETYDAYSADGYSSLVNPVRINAVHDGTLTAVFEPRYYLVGGEIMSGDDDTGTGTSSGMPGWDNYTNPFNVITSSPVLATCSLTLGANKHFYIMVRDKADGLSYGKSGETLEDNESLIFADQDNRVLFHSNGGTAYTFKISAINGSGRPTVSVERPHQLHMGHVYAGIDNTSATTSGNTGGTLTAAISESSISNGDWFNYGSDIAYTASPATGYTVTWYTNDGYSSAMSPQPSNSWTNNNVTSDENIYVRFSEKTTTVSLENDGHGKVQIGGVDKTSTTCGVTTTRTLTAVPNTGYAFRDWSKPSGDDITLSSTTTNPTTLTGVGAGLNEGQRVYASFDEVGRTITASAGTGGTVGAANYTAYIDTKTDISATPATGYKFKEWQETGGTSYVTFDNPNSASTKIRATGDATIKAVFEPRWAIAGSWKTYPESTAWDADTYKMGNIGKNGSSKDTCYVEITLPANTDLTFKIVDRGADGTVAVGSYVDYGNNTTATQYMTYNNHTNWGFGLKSSGYYDCGITTTGGGTYKFAFNITDKSLTVTYQTSYQSNFGWKYADGSGTLHDGDNGGTITVTASDGGSHTISSGDWVAAGASITYLASPAAGYAFGGWHNNSDCSTGKFNDNLSWTDGPLAATSNSYAKFVPVALTFTNDDGSGDGNWNTASNWSPACVPTIDHDVVITKPVTVDIAHATAKSIVIDQSGDNTGKLTIQANKGLEVTGTIQVYNGSSYNATTPADLVLESSASGNATLIFDNSNSCQATVQMYSKGWTTGTQGGGTWNWQFVGVPVTDATRINDYYGGYMYEWNTSTRGWDDVTNTDATLSTFKAYSVSYPTGSGDADKLHTYSIDGTLAATTNQTINVAAGQTVQAAANSWTAPIRINNITSTNWSPATIFLYNTGYNPEGSAAGKEGDSGDRYAAGKYLPIPVNSAPYLDESYIAPMQGFLFKNTKSGSAGTITLNYSSAVRTDGSEGIVAGAMHAPQRQMEAEPTVMKIYVSDSQYDDRVVLLARNDFSRGFDNGWDGEKFQVNAVKTAPRLFAINETGGKEEVSAIPEIENTVIGFRPGTEETYTIRFDYNGAETLYLRDTRTGAETLITNESEYVFLSDGTNEDARFIISRIQSTPTGLEETGAGSKAYKLMIDEHIYIIRDGRMYSVDGQCIK